MKNLNYTYAKGIVPVKIEKLRSFEGFYIDLTVNHVSDEINYNPKDKSASITTTEETAPAKIEPADEPEEAQTDSTDDARRLLQDNVETGYIPSSWNHGNGWKSFVNGVAVFVRIIIVLL